MSPHVIAAVRRMFLPIVPLWEEIQSLNVFFLFFLALDDTYSIIKTKKTQIYVLL